MGRQTRRVPADWRHPRLATGGYVPLHDGLTLGQRLADWHEHAAWWKSGFRRGWPGEPAWVLRPACDKRTVEQWIGAIPDPAHYTPRFPPELCTHLMMYDTSTQGTPVSPALPDPEVLARWLADNRVPLYGNLGVPFTTWMVVIRRDLEVLAALAPDAAAVFEAVLP